MQQRVQAWAGEFDLVESAGRPEAVAGFYLWWLNGRLALYRDREARGVSVQPAEFRRRATLRGELPRACGVTAAHKPRILDAMAGWGVDGLTLNALGCAVVMVERHAALWALLDSCVRTLGGRNRAPARAVCADAWQWLENAPSGSVDVVYLDPMFPRRRKSALPGKRLQILAELTEADPRPAAHWIELGKRHALERVVLKRRLRDPVEAVPDWQIKGHSVRYDVYRGQGALETPFG